LREGFVKEDYFYRDNEHVYKWISESCWKYESEEFEITDYEE
jgi:hypothetical protein